MKRLFVLILTLCPGISGCAGTSRPGESRGSGSAAGEIPDRAEPEQLSEGVFGAGREEAP